LAVQDGAEGPSGAEATSTDEIRAAVQGGFVKVAHNKVTIVAGVAELASQIDVPRAQRALEAAQNTVAGDAGEDAVAVAARDAAERAKVRLEAAASLVATLGAAGA
jgi:F-type H+-transporting ATPase subunit epsilon